MPALKYLKNVTTLELHDDKCTGCTICTIVCPHAVFEMQHKRAVIVDRDACMECGACANNCPEEVITVQSGVGCAYGVFVGALRGSEPTCDCETDDSNCC